MCSDMRSVPDPKISNNIITMTLEPLVTTKTICKLICKHVHMFQNENKLINKVSK